MFIIRPAERSYQILLSMVKQVQSSNNDVSAELAARKFLNQVPPKLKPIKPIKKERFCNNLKEDSFSCPICLEMMVRPVITQCGHSFCLPCLDDFFLQACKNLTPAKCCVCRKGIQFYDYHQSASLRSMVALYIRKQACQAERTSYRRRLGQVDQLQARRSSISFVINRPVDIFFDKDFCWGSASIVDVQMRTSFDTSSCDAAFETTLILEVQNDRREKIRFKTNANNRKIASHRFFSKGGEARLFL